MKYKVVYKRKENEYTEHLNLKELKDLLVFIEKRQEKYTLVQITPAEE